METSILHTELRAALSERSAALAQTLEWLEKERAYYCAELSALAGFHSDYSSREYIRDQIREVDKLIDAYRADQRAPSLAGYAPADCDAGIAPGDVY